MHDASHIGLGKIHLSCQFEFIGHRLSLLE
jgi:hypothetical protein